MYKLDKLQIAASVVNASIFEKEDVLYRWSGSDETSTPLTAEEVAAVESAYATHIAEWNAQTYARNRVAEYPSIGDQLDALWKGGDAAAEMLSQVQAVKAKYPKE
jgi:hypothetical protein